MPARKAQDANRRRCRGVGLLDGPGSPTHPHSGSNSGEQHVLRTVKRGGRPEVATPPANRHCDKNVIVARQKKIEYATTRLNHLSTNTWQRASSTAKRIRG